MSTGDRSQTLDSRNYYTRSWVGASTPKGQPYKELPYSLDEVSCRESGFLWTSYPDGVVQSESAYMSGLTPLANGDYLPDATLNELLTRNRANLVQKIQGGVNVSVFTAELPEAIESLVGSSRALLTAYSAARKGRWQDCIRHLSRGVSGISASPTRHLRGVKRDLRRDLLKAPKLDTRDIADTWLALQYGWLPLMGDIASLYTMICEYNYDNADVVFKQKDKVSVEIPATIHWNSDGSIYDAWPAMVKKIIVRRKWVLAREPSDAWKLGLTNPFVVLWEKCPMSFVVDWFIPIGNGLEGLTAAQLELKSWTRSTLRTVECNFRDWSLISLRNPKPGDSYNVYSRNTGHLLKTEYRRVVGDNVWTELLAEPERPYPPFKTIERALSQPHLLNAAALIRGFVKTARRS